MKKEKVDSFDKKKLSEGDDDEALKELNAILDAQQPNTTVIKYEKYTKETNKLQEKDYLSDDEEIQKEFLNLLQQTEQLRISNVQSDKNVDTSETEHKEIDQDKKKTGPYTQQNYPVNNSVLLSEVLQKNPFKEKDGEFDDKRSKYDNEHQLQNVFTVQHKKIPKVEAAIVNTELKDLNQSLKQEQPKFTNDKDKSDRLSDIAPGAIRDGGKTLDQGSVTTSNTSQKDIYELKKKALEAKQAGNIELAKKYLLEAKLLESPNINQPKSLEVPLKLQTGEVDKTPQIQMDNHDIFIKSIAHYEKLIEKSKSENTASKTRRYQRMLNEFNIAFEKYKNKQQYPYEELLVAPGCPNIPSDPFLIYVEKPEIKILNTQQEKKTDDTTDRINKLKQLAVEAKRAGNIEVAKNLLLQIKTIESSYKSDIKIPSSNIKIPSSDIKIPSSNVKPKIECCVDMKTVICDVEAIKKSMNFLMQGINFMSMIDTPSSDDLLPLQLLENNFKKALAKRMKQVEIEYGSNSQDIPTIFQKRYIPKLIRNILMQPEDIFLKFIRMTNLHEIVDCSSDTLMIIILNIPFPKESPKTFESNPFKYHSGAISLGFGFRFQFDRCNKALIRQIKRTKISVSIAIPGGLFRRNEVIATGNLTIDPLLMFAKVDFFVKIVGLKKTKRSTSAGITVNLNARDAICGTQVDTIEYLCPFITGKANIHLFHQLQYLDLSKMRSLELLNTEYSELEKSITNLQNYADEYDLIIAKIILFGLKLKINIVKNSLQMAGVSFFSEYQQNMAEDIKIETQKIEYFTQQGHQVTQV